jgi:preprotein translocase SecE subunit
MNVANVGNKSDGRELLRRDDGSGTGDGLNGSDGSGPRSTTIAGGGRSVMGVYKFGQGYWVRVMTAIAIGTVALITSGWVYSQFGRYEPPTRGFSLAVSNAEGTLSPGQTVELAKVADGSATKIGTAQVTKVALAGGESGTIALGMPQMAPGEDVLNTQRIDLTSADGQAVFRSSVLRVATIGAFDKLYVQAGAAGLVLVAGLVAVYVCVCSRPRSVDFLIATDGEMKKVNWGTQKLIIDSTKVVIAATFIIAAFIFLWDSILSTAVRGIGIMK